MLTLARVVNIHPESHAVDLVIMEDGRRIPGVQVLSGSAGTNFGFSDLAVPDATGYDAKNTKTRDIYAAVSWMNTIPVVVGFIFPQVSQVLFADKERMVYRHASDVYVTIDGKGNTEIYHPSGAFFRIGESGAHDDLTGKDYDKVWKIARNTGRKVHIHLEQGGGVAKLDIDPAGNIALQHAGNLSAKTGGSATIEVTGNTTVTTPTLTVNGNVVVNGNVNSTGDVTGGGVSLMNHTHPDPQGGNTSPPG